MLVSVVLDRETGKVKSREVIDPDAMPNLDELVDYYVCKLKELIKESNATN